MPPVMVVDKALQAGEFSPDSEVGESKIELNYLSTSTYIVKIQLRRSWICAMEVIENKPFVPGFHQISINPLFSTSESGFRDAKKFARPEGFASPGCAR